MPAPRLSATSAYLVAAWPALRLALLVADGSACLMREDGGHDASASDTARRTASVRVTRHRLASRASARTSSSLSFSSIAFRLRSLAGSAGRRRVCAPSPRAGHAAPSTYAPPQDVHVAVTCSPLGARGCCDRRVVRLECRAACLSCCALPESAPLRANRSRGQATVARRLPTENGSRPFVPRWRFLEPARP